MPWPTRCTRLPRVAGRRLDRMPGGVFARYGFGSLDVARLWEGFAPWPRV